MNTAFTAATRPRMASGVSSCTRVWRMNTLTMSAAPSTTRQASDTVRLVDSPKPMVARPNTATAWNMRRPVWRVQRPVGQEQGHADRTQRRHAAQQAEAPGAHAEDVAGVDRQQGGGAAEQHREQVERDGAEDDRPRADEPDAGRAGSPSSPSRAARWRRRGRIAANSTR